MNPGLCDSIGDTTTAGSWFLGGMSHRGRRLDLKVSSLLQIPNLRVKVRKVVSILQMEKLRLGVTCLSSHGAEGTQSEFEPRSP